MDVLSLVFGNVLGVTETQLYILGALAATVIVLHWCFAKELLFAAFDADMAETMDYRVQAWEFFFYLILGVAFSLSVSVAGVLVIFSYLVIPATAALVLDVGMAATFVVAVLIAVIASASGVFFSYTWDLPTGPTIVAALSALLLLCGVWRQVARLRPASAMKRAALLLVLVVACGFPRTRTTVADPRAADVRSAAVEVINGTGRDLPTPRPGVFETLARVAFGRQIPAVSAVEAFEEAAAAALRARGIRVESVKRAVPVLRITLLDLEIRNEDAAGATAFVSATYALETADAVTLWSVAQQRVSFRLAGPDLTRSELARIADQAVSAGLASLPRSPERS